LLHRWKLKLVLTKRKVVPVFAALPGTGGRVLHGVPNAFHPRKGKPVERRRRKAMGLRRRYPFRIQTPMVARLPKGWAGEEPVYPRSRFPQVTSFDGAPGSVFPITWPSVPLFSFLLDFSFKKCRCR
jgi:hypothetical protein